MKKNFLFFFLFSALVSSAQDNSGHHKQSFEIYGYVNGVRLDSINAVYAQVYYRSLS
ncbi:MAG: hypothetical protein ABI237_06285 [Ginsengibacter sp.]